MHWHGISLIDEIRPGSQKQESKPNRWAGLFGSEVKNKKTSRTNGQDCSARKSKTGKQAEQMGRIVRPGSQKQENKPNQRAGLFGPEVRNRKTSRTKGRDCSAQKVKSMNQADPLVSKPTRRRQTSHSPIGRHKNCAGDRQVIPAH